MLKKIRYPFKHLNTAVLLGLAIGLLIFNACKDESGRDLIIAAKVSATKGGTFADKDVRPEISVTIPPRALSADALLLVSIVGIPPDVGENQTAASRAFSVKLLTRKGRVSLSEPMVLQIPADPVPVHPQLGEIARLKGTTWEGLPANFFKASDNTVMALTFATKGTFEVVNRDLQRTTGPAVDAGFDVFLDETFGNEFFFGDVVGLHELLNNVAPAGAVALGAQVDLNKVPQEIVDVMVGDDLAAKDLALQDPAITRQLIKAGAVIGVKGFYDPTKPGDDFMESAGITCALCHLNVAPTEFELSSGPTLLPIGIPTVDGVPNSKMDAGAILALTPFAQGAGQETIDLLNSWGPGSFDIRALSDNPLDDGANNPTANPPIWNFIDLQDQDYLLGWDGLFENDGINNNALASQAEAVYDLVMHANGAFGTANGNFPPELSITPPQELLDALAAAETGAPGNDLDTQKILDLQTWMRSLVSPEPEPDSFDEGLAQQGFRLFYGKANCASCHIMPEFSGLGVFTDITATPPSGDLAGGIKVPGLRGIAKTAPYFHDHSAADLAAVVERFVERGQQVPMLTAEEQAALVEYLKSL
jgi:hypothetical protein